MAQTATMTKLRGRHYAAKARAAQITADAATSRATASNESMARRLRSTRFQNTRYGSPRKTTEAREVPSHKNVSSINNIRSRSSSAPKTRDRTPSRGVTAASARTNANVSGLGPIQPNEKTSSPADREMELVQGISDRLETGMNEYALRAILDLLKRGEHPDAVAAVVQSLAQQNR